MCVENPSIVCNDTCKVLARVLILSEISAARPSSLPPLTCLLSRMDLRWVSRPRALCPRTFLPYDSDSLDVSMA